MIGALVAAVMPIASSRVDAVVGGSSALGNTAVVRITNGNSVCSGALWKSRIVVTAAHCVVTTDGVVTNLPMRIFSAGVDVSLNQEFATQVGIVTVSGWQRKGTNSQADDIAFIVLDRNMPGVIISRLASTKEVVQWSADSRVVTFLGYGRTTPTSTASSSPSSIDQPLRATIFFDFAGSFTAAQTATTGVCSGDSGGPAITQVGNELVLIGINSAASGPCFASTSPSMTGFMPSAFPDLVNQALQLAGEPLLPNVTVLPDVVSDTATSIASTSAELSGTINAKNAVAQATFQYSRQPDFSIIEGSVVAGEVVGQEPTTLEASVLGLTAGVTYYWRLVATTAAGTTAGTTQSFITPTFVATTSLTTKALLRRLVISREVGAKYAVTPLVKSRSTCSFSTRTNRLSFLRSGACQVRISTTIGDTTTTSTLTLSVS